MKTMSKHWSAAAVALGPVLLAVILLGVPGRGRAEQATPPATVDQRYAGTYRYARDLDHGRAIVNAAFEKGLAQLNSITRALAESKLKGRDPLIRAITISLPGEKIAVRLESEKTIDFVTTPGVAQDVRGPNGNKVKLTQRFTRGALEQIGVGPRGTTRTTLRLSDDARTLTYNSTMTSSLLSSPVAFTLVYARQQGD